MSARLLLVEDEVSLARGLVDNFRAEGYEVRHVARGDLAPDAVREFRPDLVLLDITLLRKVDNHVVALRRAIGDDPRRPRFIQTVRGSGYRLAPADND